MVWKVLLGKSEDLDIGNRSRSAFRLISSTWQVPARYTFRQFWLSTLSAGV